MLTAARSLLATFCILTLAAAFSTPALAEQEKQQSPSGILTQVEPDKVCMVNNTLFPNKQIPVDVAGKTYYGCCEMCKARLQKNAAIRSAVDPISGKPVDKAQAVIGARKDGKVVYFENKSNLEKFNTPSGS